MNVKDIALKLYKSSSGILAVGIVPWVQGNLTGSEGAFLSQQNPARPWKDLFQDALRMLTSADRYRSLDKLLVRIENLNIGLERQGDWVIVVGTVSGHDVHKNLRRAVQRTFNRLQELEDQKVIPFPGADILPPKGRKPKGNIKPG